MIFQCNPCQDKEKENSYSKLCFINNQYNMQLLLALHLCENKYTKQKNLILDKNYISFIIEKIKLCFLPLKTVMDTILIRLEAVNLFIKLSKLEIVSLKKNLHYALISSFTDFSCYHFRIKLFCKTNIFLFSIFQKYFFIARNFVLLLLIFSNIERFFIFLYMKKFFKKKMLGLLRRFFTFVTKGLSRESKSSETTALDKNENEI